jgi:3-hydroxyacyl-[acyl-carrier-protein] dehydratase
VTAPASSLCIGADHPSLPGHFPGQPVVPGVVILDLVASHARTLLGEERRLHRIPQVKFLAPLLPGERAAIELDADAEQGRVRFRVLREGVLLASGDLVFAPA